MVLAALRRAPGGSFASGDADRADPSAARGVCDDLARTPNDRGDEIRASGRWTRRASMPEAWSRRTSCAKVAIVDTGVDLRTPICGRTSGRTRRRFPAMGSTMTRTASSTMPMAPTHRRPRFGPGRQWARDRCGRIIAARGKNRRGHHGRRWTASLVGAGHGRRRNGSKISTARPGIAYAASEGARVIKHVVLDVHADRDPVGARSIRARKARAAPSFFAAAGKGEQLNAGGSQRYPAAAPRTNVVSVAATGPSRPPGLVLEVTARASTSRRPGTRSSRAGRRRQPLLQRHLDGRAARQRRRRAAAAQGYPSAPRIRSRLLSTVSRKSALKGKVRSAGVLNVAPRAARRS